MSSTEKPDIPENTEAARYRSIDELSHNGKPLREILQRHEEWFQSNGESGQEADLRKVNFRGAYLEGADLTKADLAGADLTGTNLGEADFNEATLLAGAFLTEANLTEANLVGADLPQANLFDADLTEAILVDANLTQADLYRANLSQTNLARANLDQASVLEVVYMPVGTRGRVSTFDILRASRAMICAVLSRRATSSSSRTPNRLITCNPPFSPSQTSRRSASSCITTP